MDNSYFAMALLLYLCYLINTLHSMFIYQASDPNSHIKKRRKNLHDYFDWKIMFLSRLPLLYTAWISPGF